MLPNSDLIIAGAGPAGLSAAINAASEGLSVTVVSDAVGGQARWSNAIENVPGFPRGISGKDYANRAYRQAKKFGARFIEDKLETFCTLNDGTIAAQLHSARLMETRSLIIATGLTPKPLTIPGSDSFGVFTHANPDELTRYSGKSIAIVGGGNSAGQAAQAFLKHGAKVTLFARSPLSNSMSRYLIDRLTSHADIRENIDLKAINRAGTQLRIDDAIFDAVFSFVGSQPDHALPVPTDDRGYIITDPSLACSRGVYAIGDVRSHSTKRIATAVGEGSAVVPVIHKQLGK